MRWALSILLVVVIAGCSAHAPRPATLDKVAALAARIAALSPNVDPVEANRAAQTAYEATFSLAMAYQISDPPLIHNAKVNAGQRPRGLCYHWAEDMEARLNAEGFETLEMTRAIANADNLLLIEHSTAVITATGANMQSGIVLDPWRKGGVLFWENVRDDRRYDWIPREDALRAKGQIRYAQITEGSLAPPPQ